MGQESLFYFQKGKSKNIRAALPSFLLSSSTISFKIGIVAFAAA
jgi:hypothetical protein